VSAEEIALARRLIACGLPVPAYTVANGGICASWEVAPATPSVPYASTWEVELWPGDTCRPFGTAPSAGLLFGYVATDTGPELLPVLDSPMLLGWLIAELERAIGTPITFSYNSGMPNLAKVAVDPVFTNSNPAMWAVNDSDHCDTRLEALVAALEAAKAAS